MPFDQDAPESATNQLATKEWRGRFPVMVMQASAIGMIGVIRSLGRAGYPVHACASDAGALGLESNFAGARAIHPDYDDAAFLEWLRNYCATHRIAAIVPSEGFLHAIRPAYAEFAPLIPVSNDPSIIYRSMSKSDTFAALLGAPREERLGLNNPPTLVVSRTAPLESRDALERLGLPLFIKVDACHSEQGGENQVIKSTTVEEAFEVVTGLSEKYRKILVQGFVPGKKVAADFCIVNGEVVTESMWEATHENPHRGGMASLRHVCWHQEIRDDALNKLRHLEWEGAAMMEYRRDPETNKFYFIELNARFWGGLHSELFAGIDIPRMQLDRFLGAAPEAFQRNVRPVVCRHTVPGEIGYVLSRIRDEALPVTDKIWSAIEFFLLFLDPRVKSDLLFPGDRKLYFSEWKRFLFPALR